MRRLHIYDFDETLVKTMATVRVMGGESVKKLTPAQFAAYQPSPGDAFDFAEFDAIIHDAHPIEVNLQLLRDSLSNPSIKTTILTARGLAFPVRQYLRERFGIEAYVVALADGNPNKKAEYVESELKKGYSEVLFVDDSIHNVKAVRRLQKHYPAATIKVIHTLESSKLDPKHIL